MSDRCELKATQGELAHCDEESCVFWRVVGHLGVESPEAGCAIQYFSLLDEGSDVAAWLLSVKHRIEQDPDAAPGIAPGA